MKNIRYFFEYLLLLFLLGICKVLPWTWASSLFGYIAQTIGPKTKMNDKAVRHIRSALQCDEATAQNIAKGHWNNLGRVMAEYPHLDHIAQHNVHFNGVEYINQAREDNKPGIFFSIHSANWEIGPHAMLKNFDLAAHPIYRAPNNQFVDKLLHGYRTSNGQLTLHPKSKRGMMGMVKAMKAGEHLGILVDQKYNEGVTVPFFGMNANTGVAFIELAKKYDCPLIPIQYIREKNGFLIDVHPPIPTLDRDVLDILTDAHKLMEGWIRQHPEQWLWLHRRWKNEELRDVKN